MDENEGLFSLPDNSISLCFADPPFNINLPENKNDGKTFVQKAGRTKKVYYEDDMSPEEYKAWCEAWFSELIRVCERVVIYCGTDNVRMWYDIADPVGKFVYVMSFNTIITRIAWAGRYRDLMVYAKDKNEFLGRKIPVYANDGETIVEKKQTYKLHTDVIIKDPNWNIIPKRDYIHPCPIDDQLPFKIIKQLNPDTVIDPFMGSGSTAEVCEILGIKWLGYEKVSDYKQDLDLRMRDRIRIPKYRQQKLVF
jgi:DNA modification methylase